MPISITAYLGSPNKFTLKVDYTEPAGAASLRVKLFDADTNVLISDYGTIAAGNTTKTYSPVVVGNTVNNVLIEMFAISASGVEGPASRSAPAAIDRAVPGPVIL